MDLSKFQFDEEKRNTMFDVEEYIQKLIGGCKNAFAERLLYVGLQGSYMRGEATEKSDIDVMIILEDFSVEDMDVYRELLKRIGNDEKSCGFICGREEMMRWNPLEICQLHHTTKDLFGTLKDFLPLATREDEINYVKLSLGNLYHELCHRYIHSNRERNVAAFRGTCKNAFFLIQNLQFLERGSFVVRKEELKEQVSEEDRVILELSELPDDYDYDTAFRLIICWCQSAFERISLIQ
jgi:predicted nucleotidyltransferase